MAVFWTDLRPDFPVRYAYHRAIDRMPRSERSDSVATSAIMVISVMLQVMQRPH